MAVHSTKDWEQRSAQDAAQSNKEVEGQSVKAASSGKKAPKRKLDARKPNAPMGKANIVVQINGKPAQLPLNNQVYRCTKSVNGARPKDVFDQLLRQGFEDESYWTGQPKGKKKGTKYGPNTKATWKFMHPENTRNHPINGNYAFSVNGEPVQLEVKEGIVRTKDFYTAQELERHGFILQSVREHKENER